MRARAPVARMMCGAVSAWRGLAVLLDRDRALAVEPALAVEHGDLVFPQQVLDAAVELARDLARALDHLVEIVAQLLGAEAELLEVMHEVENLGRAQQRLGRDAAPVQADAAQVLALDECCLHAELGGPDCRDIAPRPAADHDQIERLRRHQVFPLAAPLLRRLSQPLPDPQAGCAGHARGHDRRPVVGIVLGQSANRMPARSRIRSKPLHCLAQ